MICLLIKRSTKALSGLYICSQDLDSAGGALPSLPTHSRMGDGVEPQPGLEGRGKGLDGAEGGQPRRRERGGLGPAHPDAPTDRLCVCPAKVFLNVEGSA